MKKNRLLSPAICLLASLVITSSVQAATIGHWRFENSPGFLNDSAGSYILTNNNDVTQVATPFGSTVPQTSASNEYAASFNGTNAFLASGADPNFDLGNAFTIEAYFRPNALTGTHMIASHTRTSDNQRSWFLATNDASGIRMNLSANGTNNKTENAFNGSLTTGKSYYVAAAFDGSTHSVTFYLKNLTDDTALQTATIAFVADGSNITSVHNSSAHFNIGAAGNGDVGSVFDGIIDEVRLSDTALSQGQLMIIPEPGAYGMLVGFATLACVMLRRRRRHA